MKTTCAHCNTDFDTDVTRYCPLCRHKPKGPATQPKKSALYVFRPGGPINLMSQAPITNK